MERLTERESDETVYPADVDDYCAGYCKVTDKCANCAIQRCYQKLADLEDAEEQGRLIKIPTDYKGAVFFLETLPCLHINQLEFYGMELTGIGTENDSRYIIAGKNGYTDYFNAVNVGETIFFSEKEAEKKLKELQAGNDNRRKDGLIWND